MHEARIMAEEIKHDSGCISVGVHPPPVGRRVTDQGGVAMLAPYTTAVVGGP